MIKFEHVTKKYGRNITALDDLNFEIDDGEFVVMVGPSGAGKSTLIKLLICEEKPTRGHIYIVGKDIVNLKEREIPFYRRRVGVVFQDFKLLPKKNVYENVAFALEVVGASNREIKKKVEAVLSLVGLKKRRENFPDELSGGEKQRVAIARAVVNRPKLLIADEPTGNLDPETSWEIIKLLEEINERGTIVMMATHNKEIVNRIRKRVIKIKNGKIVSDKERAMY